MEMIQMDSELSITESDFEDGYSDRETRSRSNTDTGY